MKNGALEMHLTLISTVLGNQEFIVELPQMLFKNYYDTFASTCFLESRILSHIYSVLETKVMASWNFFFLDSKIQGLKTFAEPSIPFTIAGRTEFNVSKSTVSM